MRIGADVGLADVVAEDDEDVRLAPALRLLGVTDGAAFCAGAERCVAVKLQRDQ